MAQMIPLALAVAGTALSAGGTILGSQSEGRELNLQANQLDIAAGTERASSQRAAIDERRQAKLLNSRALAVAGASGGGVDDPTVINAMAGISQEGEYRALTALYNGNEAAAGMEADAAAKRRGAKSVKTAGIIKAAGTVANAAPTIISGGSSLFSRYG